MRAASYSEWGGPISVGDMPEPAVADGEQLVSMAFAGLNPLDLTIHKGSMPLKPPLPQIPGMEGAGWANGRPVLVFGKGIGVMRGGTITQRMSAPAEALFDIPDGLPLEQAAACGAGGATAMRLFELANATPGDVVLVLAGAGNIGAMVTSLFAYHGIRVIVQTRSEAKAGIIVAAGGEPLVLDDPQGLADAMPERPTIVIDPLGGSWLSTAADIAQVGGRLITYAAMTGPVTLNIQNFYRQCLTLRGYSGLGEPAEHARCIRSAMQAARDGQLKIEPLLRRYDLDRAPEAIAELERGAAGKLIIDIGTAQ